MPDDYIKALEENNRLLRELLESHPTVYEHAARANTRRMIDNLNLQDEWAAKYGECVTQARAAQIVNKTPRCIQNWANQGRIIRVEGGDILTKSLAAYLQTGVPQGDFHDDPAHPIRRSSFPRTKKTAQMGG